MGQYQGHRDQTSTLRNGLCRPVFGQDDKLSMNGVSSSCLVFGISMNFSPFKGSTMDWYDFEERQFPATRLCSFTGAFPALFEFLATNLTAPT